MFNALVGFGNIFAFKGSFQAEVRRTFHTVRGLKRKQLWMKATGRSNTPDARFLVVSAGVPETRRHARLFCAVENILV